MFGNNPSPSHNLALATSFISKQFKFQNTSVNDPYFATSDTPSSDDSSSPHPLATPAAHWSDWAAMSAQVLMSHHAQSAPGPIALEQLLADELESGTYSTAFSGIDSPGSAMLEITNTIEDLTGHGIKPMTHTNAIEWDIHCQNELKDHPSRPLHIHGDINSFWRPAVRRSIDALIAAQKPLTFEDFVPLLKSGQSVLSQAPCVCCVPQRALCDFYRTRHLYLNELI